MYSFFSKALIGSLVCFTVSSFAEEPCSNGTQHFRTTIRHIESSGIGYNQGYTTLQFFLAPDPSRLSIVPLMDLRGHVFDDGKFAANAGLGVRALADCRVFGANIYYDYRNTKHQHYNQVGVGFETLGIRWDFRANAYLPVGPKKSSFYDVNTTSVAAFDTFQGHQALIRQTVTSKGKVQFAMTGVNAEAAFHILKNENIDLYAAVSPYYYNYGSKQAIGGQVRLGAQIYEYLSLQVINSYDSRFHENIQGSIGINIPFGPKPKISKRKKFEECSFPCLLAQRLVQDVERQEIIVVDKKHKTKVSEVTSPAIDPLTGNPYFFVFVNNTSHSQGTYESPYPTFALAQANSSPGDIIYVFPGDGTTTGMDSGISLQASQKFWGSGISHLIQTTAGTITIPVQSNIAPTITNTNIDTDGNAVTLATNNAISGFTITSAMNDAIFGADPQNLEIASCTIENNSTFALQASFSGATSISLTNNQFLNNVNGVILTLDGTSTVICSDNTFEGHTSVSNVPLEIAADSNVLAVQIENNVFNDNTTGSIRFDFNNVVTADISALNNTITNNGTGSEGSSLGSSFVIIPNGTNDNCSIELNDNTFSNNASNSFYVHTSGAFTTFEVIASTNTMSNNGGSAIVFASTCTTFTLNATDNTLTNLHDNGISTAGSTSFQTANITINGNTITDIGNGQSAIAIAQGSSTLNFTAEDNTIDTCEGSGIFCFANEFTNMTANIIGNKISNCLNNQSNAASGISLDTYVNLTSTVTDNILSDNASPGVAVGLFSSGNPSVCLTLTGNSSDTNPGYSLTNPGSAAFNLSPCNVDTVNTGTIDTSGVTSVQSCPDATPCPP